MYDYGKASMAIHVFLSTGSAFSSSTTWVSMGEWIYDANKVTGRFAAGDVDGDGRDDLVAMYEYNNAAMKLTVFRSQGSSFSNGNIWYTTPEGTFHAPNVTDRFVLGDFNGDGKDDVACMYDYGNAKEAIFIFVSTGTAFTGGYTWHYSPAGIYDVKAVANRFVAGDFNGDGKDDVAAMYDYGDAQMKIHNFISSGSAFSSVTAYNTGKGVFEAGNIQNLVRISASMRDDVDPAVLQTALQNSIKRYPYFNVCLRRGIFWHYLEELDGKPEVVPDSDYLIKDIDSIETYGYNFRVSYFNNKISIDCFHALCDGNGCMEFFKTILFEYVRLSGDDVDPEGKIRLPENEPLPDEAEDGFLKYAQKVSIFHLKGVKDLQGSKAYTFPDARFDFKGSGVIEGTVDTAKLLERAHAYHTTVTAYSAAVLINANAGDAGLTTAGAVKILLLALVHSVLPPISPESRLRASGQHEDAQHPCTGADGSCSYGPECSWAACP